MDVVLEVVDTFAGDYLYAFFHPARQASYDFPSTPSNETISDQVFSTWAYKPSTSFFSLQPSEYAWKSAWPRDNIYRQALSLYLIVWYASHCPPTLFIAA